MQSIIRIIPALILFSLLLSSCGKNMEGLNEDKKLITDKMLEQDANEGGISLPGMQSSIMDALSVSNYGMQQFLNADIYGGYVMHPWSIFAERTNWTYSMVDAWNNQIWNVASTKVLDQWVMMKKKGFEAKYPDLYSLAVIFKVFAGHRLVDIFGPMPYSFYGSTSNVKFDSEEEAYDMFFDELREVVARLKEAESANPLADQVRYARFDKSRYGGNYATWIKVANTLRLRLAIRISNVNPSKAKAEAEAAVNDGGVLSGSDGSFEVICGVVHPFWTITKSWTEGVLNASVESILGGYNDPRLLKYALPAVDPLLNGAIKGVRTGAIIGGKNYLDFSLLNFSDNQYLKIMDVAESYFLRAEGALRGWDMGGMAGDFYNEGIRVSFNALGLTGAEDYLNDNTSTPQPYIDPLNSANNAGPATNITIKWDESASDAEKLERIITQKWIAMYPEGQEAWSEFRRTGYPKLYPVVQNFSNGDVPIGEFIKRIPYPSAITNASQSAVDEAVNAHLDGQDKMFTPIWWDVD